MLHCAVQQCKQVCSQFTSPRTLPLSMPRMMPLYLLKKLKLFVSASKRTGTTKDSTCSRTSPPAFAFCQLQVHPVSITAAFKSKGSHTGSFPVSLSLKVRKNCRTSLLKCRKVNVISLSSSFSLNIKDP